MLRNIAILLLALAPAAAAAGLRATFAVEHGAPLTVEIDDHGDIRADLRHGRVLLVRGGRAVVVEDRLTGPLVTRVENLEIVAAEMAGPRSVAAPAGANPAVRDGTAEVNGRTGRAYFLPNRQGSGPSELFAVISDDPALAPLAAAMRHVDAAEMVLSQLDFPELPVTDKDWLTRLVADGMPLKLGERSLRRLETVAIPSDRMALPAEPESLNATRDRIRSGRTAAEADDGVDRMISRAVFAAGRLWLLTDSGSLTSLAEGETARTVHDAGGRAVDLCVVGDAPFILTGDREVGEAWTVRRWENGRWLTVRSIARAGDDLVAMACAHDGQFVLTSRRLIDLDRTDAAVTLTEDVPRARVNSIVHVTPDAVYLGINVGEWGGGLRRIDRRTGRIETIERNATGELCDGPLNTDCDPVQGIAPLPWRPRCIAVAIGLIHMMAHGRIVSVCPEGIEQLFAIGAGIDPEDSEDAAIAARGGLGSVAFFGLAPIGDALVAVGHNGLYRIDSTGAAVHERFPRFIEVDGILVSFARRDMVLVMTELNRRASVSGIAPLLAVR